MFLCMDLIVFRFQLFPANLILKFSLLSYFIAILRITPSLPQIYGGEKLHQLVLDRPDNRPLITVRICHYLLFCSCSSVMPSDS